MGDHDYVQEALTNSGVAIDFWKIAMRPGKPFMYGRRKGQHVLGLPGNPGLGPGLRPAVPEAADRCAAGPARATTWSKRGSARR